MERQACGSDARDEPTPLVFLWRRNREGIDDTLKKPSSAMIEHAFTPSVQCDWATTSP